jgi:hypothetical protein
MMSRTYQVEYFIGKQGYPTLRIHGDRTITLHSVYNPVAEAVKVAAQWGIQEGTEKVFIVGMGLGYHVVACAQQYPWLQKIVVMESRPDVVQYALRALPQLAADERIEILVPTTENEFRRMLQEHQSDILCLHMPSVDCLPFPSIRPLLQEMHMIQTSTESSRQILQNNWNANCSRLSVASIVSGQRDCCLNRPGFLVSAGPSLEVSLPLLSKAERHGTVILAVTRSIELLVRHNVVPTGLVATDPSEALIHHFRDLKYWPSVPPLYALPTVHPNAIRAYTGPLKWVLQEGMHETEEYARTHHADLFPTGGSVATLALALLYYFGCNPIIFLGQDLAYVNDKSHAGEGAHMRPAQNPRYVLEVASVHGDMIQTTLSWDRIHGCAHKGYESADPGTSIDGTKLTNVTSG